MWVWCDLCCVLCARAQTLFLTGGLQMIAAEVVMAALLGVYFKGAIGDHVPADVGIGILVVVCLFVSGFAYSWGPLAWLVRDHRQAHVPFGFAALCGLHVCCALRQCVSLQVVLEQQVQKCYMYVPSYYRRATLAH